VVKVRKLIAILVPKLVAMTTSLSTAGPLSTHDSYGPSEPTTQTASRSVQPFLHMGPQSAPILYNAMPLSPSKLPLPMGDVDSHLMYGSLGRICVCGTAMRPKIEDGPIYGLVSAGA